MPSINKNDYWKDRQNGHGKGDYFRGPMEGYRNGEFFGRSKCCNATVTRIHGKDTCDECGKLCQKTKVKK